MKKLDITLENCFGIGKFQHVFDFDQIPTNTFLIYAPNGTMKTSFAKTLSLISKNDPQQVPCDKIQPHRATICTILADGNPISPESILVVNAEDAAFDATDKISSFIARKELKDQYDKIYQALNSQKDDFIKKLKNISQSTDCEGEVIATFQPDGSATIFEILTELTPGLTDKPIKYSFKYNDVFDKKGAVQKFLTKNETLIDEYINKYNEVLSSSTFFKASANSFGTYQANEIIKSTDGDSFFQAGHKFTLDGGKNIGSSKELRELVKSELDRIISAPDLRKAFDKVDKEITTNVELRAFQKVIENDHTLLLELKDYEGFKKKVWVDYLSQIKDQVEQLVEFYKSQKPEIEKILAEARKEIEIWKEIVEKFNSRFYVPFVVALVNQEDILLKEKTAALEFIYDDNNDAPVKQDKDNLLKILSKGEQRAYYILQFLFEVESRRALCVETLLILDDIADSFDYKNKFAIIEYINELHHSTGFNIIILTHNFDFYRTVGSRIHLSRTAIFMTKRSMTREVVLVNGQYIKGAFPHFITRISEEAIFVSVVPFVRNLIEYADGTGDAEYLRLTSCLHIKADTDTIDAASILAIYYAKLPKTVGKTILFGHKNIKDLVYETAASIAGQAAPDEVALENKIVLSMGIRLKAEEYMIAHLPSINTSTITKNQTKALYDEILKLPGTQKEVIRVLDRVILMTPENIHLNAFMYEPLIDMSLIHLVDLYNKVTAL